MFVLLFGDNSNNEQRPTDITVIAIGLFWYPLVESGDAKIH